MKLTTGSLEDHIREIAIPASVGFFFNTMLNVVDTFFAGLVSTEAIASLSISFPVFFMVISIVQGLSTAASTLISNAVGAGDEKKAEHVSAQILTYALFSYIFVCILGLYTSGPIFKLLGATGAYLVMAKSYMDVIFIGSIFFIMAFSANSILYAHGKSKYIRNYLIFAFFLNAVLNPWFLFGGLGIPAMGLKGIALATVVSMLCGCIYIFYIVIAKGYLIIVSWKDFIPQRAVFEEITEQSIPTVLNLLTVGIGIFVITYYIKNFGEAAVAAYGIGMRIEQIFLLPSIGLTVATLNIIGQNNGAGQMGRVKETLEINLRYGGWIACFGLLVMSLLAKPLYLVFSRSEEVIAIGIPYLHVAALTLGAYIIVAINTSAMQAMKKPKYALIIGLLRQIIVPGIVFTVLIKYFHSSVISIWWSIFAITWGAAIGTIVIANSIIKKKMQ